VTGTGYQRQADSVAFQLQLAEAALKVDTAELHSHRAAADIDSALATGRPLDRLRRARVRADTGLAVQSVVDAIGLLLSAHGRPASLQTTRCSGSGGTPTWRCGTRWPCRR